MRRPGNPLIHAQTVIAELGLGALLRSVAVIDAIEAQRPPPGDMAILNHPAMSAALTELCSWLGQATHMLFDDGPRRGTENARVYQARLHRVRRVLEMCEGIDLAPLRDRAVRNRLIHADEHYIATVLREPDAPWMMHLAVTHREQIQQPGLQHFLVYVFEGSRLLHLGRELDLASARIAALHVVERFRPYELNIID